MNAKRKLSSAAVVLILVACGTGSRPKTSSEDPGIAAAKEQILTTSACGEDGATLNVPSEKYPTIAAGLAAAKSGDRVRVAAGTYQECPYLVDGVTIEGPTVRHGEPPMATLDGMVSTGGCLSGANCPTGVVCGNESIVHCATIRGFRIINARNFGVHLSSAKGVNISEMTIENSPGAGVRADVSSFVLEHSKLIGNSAMGQASVRASHGSQAVLVANDIEGLAHGVFLDAGGYLSDPSWAPSKAWLINNVIHHNSRDGLWVRDSGTEVRGVGNRYDANYRDGVVVAGGAAYSGQDEAMTHSALGSGMVVMGCDLKCPSTANCPSSSAVVVQEHSAVRLHKATISDNQGDGLYANCGGTVDISKSMVATNGGVGAKAQSTLILDATHVASVPSAISASDTHFTNNTYSGLWLIEKGTTGQGFKNGFTGNHVAGIQVTGGASYEGRDETISNNDGGVFALGCELLCTTPGCPAPTLIAETSHVRLDRVVIQDNQDQGVAAGCGAVVDLRESISASNANGVVAVAYVDFGGGYDVTAPSTISAHETVFSGNLEWGVIAYDSWLTLGSTENPGRNSFLSNGVGSIANVSPNPVLAQWNWFGTTDPLAIAATIGGVNVTYEPFLTRAPSARR